MSITLRLIIGGIVFAVIAGAFGTFSLYNQSHALSLAMGIHDDAVVPLDRLTVAQSRVERLRDRLEMSFASRESGQRPVLSDQEKTLFTQGIQDIKSELVDVFDSELSEKAIFVISGLRYPLSRLSASEGNLSQHAVLTQLGELSGSLSEASQIVRNDLQTYRNSADTQIKGSMWLSLIGLGSIILALLAFAYFMARAVAGPLRYVTSVARTVATPQHCDPIVPRGPKEIATMLMAIAQMQSRCASLAETMSHRTTALSGQLAEQQDQLSAALNNMTQALCMLDGDKKLLVCNEVFKYYFGEHALGTSARVFLRDPRLTSPLPRNETSVILMETERGEIMEVKRRGMTGRGLLITFEDITERQKIAEKLEHVAGHDGLTDLPNRHSFAADVDELLARRRDDFVLLVLDIRNFKSINDTFGHPIGDALLVQSGERLMREVGPKATVARLGGDEFGVVAPGIRLPEVAEEFAQSIVAAFAEPFDIEGRRINAGLSVGLIHVRPSEIEAGTNADILLQNCDLALYQAKEAPRSGFRMFQPAMRERLRDRREMELDLKVALENDQLELFYQPFVDAGRNTVSGFEALLRWRHPVKGMISPAVFVPLAEETGLIEQIGTWCLQTACRQAAEWPSGMTISVNLSPVQFRSPTLLSDIDSALAQSGIEPKRLQIEVTESLFLDESDNILAILQAFRKRGLTISMDDFGTGYSSLGYLSRFPFDKIKIDQSFVRDLSRPENIAIVRSVISLSRALKMNVMAEGIETHEQMQILYDEGCREMQGYFFSKPRPGAELAQMTAEIGQRWSTDLKLTRSAQREAA
ncbi:MAG: EAL domain-containing protein [Pseudomonadota bacterium]|nr:EAL domain-containing protein [Pseudomonadota bacterium]